MAARAALAVAALVACVCLAAGLRSSRLLADGERPFQLGQVAEFEQRRGALEDAQRFNPDPTAEIREAQILVVANRDRDAIRVLQNVVEREPENYEAWLALRQAASEADSRLFRRATREALRLNPLASSARERR